MFAVMTMGNTAVAPLDTTTPANPEPIVSEQAIEPSVQDALLYVCNTRGYGEGCAKTLFGMLWIESSNISTAVGDSGLARGYYQIHCAMHGISTACAEDIVCSANWTLTYMERNGYPSATYYAVQCHNGCHANNGYVERAQRATWNLWDTPLAISQSAPVRLTTELATAN